MISVALDIAMRAHDGQFRKFSKAPYIQHPMRVALDLVRRGVNDPRLIAVALNHDVKEDCDPKFFDEILEKLGQNVADGVSALTNPSKGLRLPRAERKKMDREHLHDSNLNIKVIKMLDRLDNVTEMAQDIQLRAAPKDFGKLYAGESLALLDALKIGTDSSFVNMVYLDLQTDLLNAIRNLEEICKN